MMDKNLLENLSQISEEESMLLSGNELQLNHYVSGRGKTIESAKMLQKGKLIDIRLHTRFCDFPDHSHDYIEMMYVCSGRTHHIIDKREPLELKRGELLLLNQHATHSISKTEKDDIAVNFIILPEFFDTALEMIGSDNVLASFIINSLKQEHSYDSPGYLHFRVSDILPIQNIVESMIWSLVNRQPNSQRINQVSMGLLFLQLLNNSEYLSVSKNLRSTNTMLVETIRLIEENYRTASLSEIAEQYNVSAAYLSKLIKNMTGATFTDLLQKKRLSKAASLLQTTSLSVQDIILAVGYDNTSYFYRIFKSVYGVSPSEYRAK